MSEEEPQTPREVQENLAVAAGRVALAYSEADARMADHVEKGLPLTDVIVNSHTEKLMAIGDAITELMVSVNALAAMLDRSEGGGSVAE